MADVDMKDAAASGSKGKGSSGKPRFEVKKVRDTTTQLHLLLANMPHLIVERRRPLVVGYRRRELRHLP
jgi:hypothetical protein